MSPEENKAIARRFYEEIFNNHNLTVIDELVAFGCVEHPGTRPDQSREDLRQGLAEAFGEFPDIHATIEDMVAEGNKVVARLRIQMTHQSEFMGIPPTDKVVTLPVIDILRFEQGQIAEIWVESDRLGWLQQLGVISTSDV
jgi:steroid delta-isomerase-like uncharacterized protein